VTLEPEGWLPRTTPLLAEGELRRVGPLIRGWLGEYLEAQIAIVSRAPGGSESGEAEVDLTVAVNHVPKAKPCRRRSASSPGCSATASRTSTCWGVFLLDLAPKGLAFEYVEGTLCVSQSGRLTLAEDIDGLRDAMVELVARFRAEARERLGEARGRSGTSGWES
jgi:hypothetical protein